MLDVEQFLEVDEPTGKEEDFMEKLRKKLMKEAGERYIEYLNNLIKFNEKMKKDKEGGE